MDRAPRAYRLVSSNPPPLEGLMLRSLLPPVLALLLLPGVAAAAPAASGQGGETVSADAGPHVAGKKKSSNKGGKGSDRSGGKDSGGSRPAPSSSRPAPSSSRPAPSSGDRGGAEHRPANDAPRPSSSDRDSGDSPSRRSDPERAPAEREPADRSDARPAPASGPTARPGDNRPSVEGARPTPQVDGARPTPVEPRGAEAGRPSPADQRGVEAGRPTPGDLRGADGGRPTPIQPTVRPVNVGTPSALAARQPAAPGLPQAAAANLRGVRPASAANLRAPSPGGKVDALGGERHVTAGRYGTGSDAERATYGSHAASERHHAAVRHARATAAAHRSTAAWRRTAVARHHAWAAARHHRYHRWYHPGGWFRPWRPGHAYWYHGVFVYGPYPWHHHHHHHTVVVEGGGSGGEGPSREEASEPVRKVDRTRTFAIGVRGGSYLGGYDFAGGGFGDAGLGVAARYRPVEALGLEVSWMHHDQTWDDATERVYQPLQASVQVFGLPWTKVNPYVLAGVTVTGRKIEDNLGFTTVTESSTLWGPHGGLGLELGLGQKASINFDARYTGYLNKPPGDLTVPGALQGNMGVNFYF